MSEPIQVKVERFEYTRRINDNGYDHEETVYKFRVVDNNGNVVDDNDGIGFFTEEEALDDLFEIDDDVNS
jgi:hypothetical protein